MTLEQTFQEVLSHNIVGHLINEFSKSSLIKYILNHVEQRWKSWQDKTILCNTITTLINWWSWREHRQFRSNCISITHVGWCTESIRNQDPVSIKRRSISLYWDGEQHYIRFFMKIKNNLTYRFNAAVWWKCTLIAYVDFFKTIQQMVYMDRIKDS